MNRRTLLKGLGVAAATPALAACSGGGGGAASEGSNTITMMYNGDATQQKAFKALFAEFGKVNSKIKLVAQGIPAASWAAFSNTVATRIAGGQVPDIIQIATEGQRLFASKGLLTPLEPFIEKDRALVDGYLADIDPNLKKWNTEYASPDGKTYYMPGGYNTMALYAREDLFEKAGVDLPDKDWTWDDFRAAGERIKSKTGAFLVPAASGYFTDVMPWLTTNGASTFDEQWATPTFDSPEAVEAAEFVRGLVEDGLAPKPGGTYDAPTQMKQGKLATLGGGRWPTLNMRDLDMVDAVRIVDWPTKTQNGSPVGWDAWPITKASKNKEAAWEFIKFLISKDAGRFYAESGGTIVPARRSVAGSSAFTDDAPAGSLLLREAISYATPIPSPDRGAECQKVIEEAWLTIVSGNGAAADVLGSANDKLAALV
ncbi:MAG: sugar ABC transporter substrate-binding protein [Nocardioidaceae bacterium]|nr:sugar ABC transporter substrate-binding protein [Nocardioidaceae bacterium]